MCIRDRFCSEVALFVYICVYGTHGIQCIKKLTQENDRICQEIHKQEESLAQIKTVINGWNNESFLKEKVAREKLKLARKDDTVYYIQ